MTERKPWRSMQSEDQVKRSLRELLMPSPTRLPAESVKLLLEGQGWLASDVFPWVGTPKPDLDLVDNETPVMLASHEANSRHPFMRAKWWATLTFTSDDQRFKGLHVRKQLTGP